MTATPRIVLISALAQSPGPAMAAMREAWPQAHASNLLDDSLAADLAAAGRLSAAMMARFLTLGRYAACPGGEPVTAGILFTCSAFGPAIDAVKADLTIPVLAPNEGAFDEALALCRAGGGAGRVGLLLSFSGSLAPLSAEFAAMATAAGQPMPELVPAIAEGALAALQEGDAARHDALIRDAAAALPRLDALIIGQFSMARAAAAVQAVRAEPVLTTPHAAVRKLRRLVEMQAAQPAAMMAPRSS